MKKIIVMAALCGGALFASCGKNDDGPKQDQLIGTWLLVESSTIEDGQTTKKELTDCDKQTGNNFGVEGNFESTSYYLDNDECKLNASTKGTWKNLGDSVYQTQWGDSTYEQKIAFSGNTFSTNSKDGEITYIDVYQKVD